MTEDLKRRWQRNAGIPVKEESNEESDEEVLQEGFKNLGMVSPGIMGGNPFERSTPVNEAGALAAPARGWGYNLDLEDKPGDVEDEPDESWPAERGDDLLRQVLRLAEKYDLTSSPDGGEACEELVGEIERYLDEKQY